MVPVLSNFPTLLWPPFQKNAQRDQPAMLELLQISCLMNYLWPQLESHFGKGKLLDEIADMWSLGFLSWNGKIQKTMHIWGVEFSGLEYCGFEIPL